VGRRFPWNDSDEIQHARANYNSALDFAYDTSPTKGSHPDYYKTSPVDAFPANGYCLYDMAGNVWEWCWDWYDSAYYDITPGIDPRGPGAKLERALRGGSYTGVATDSRVAVRSKWPPDDVFFTVSFRIARTAP
jgi:formylglycine-generating enzyme required for sulfatase activity